VVVFDHEFVGDSRLLEISVDLLGKSNGFALGASKWPRRFESKYATGRARIVFSDEEGEVAVEEADLVPGRTTTIRTRIPARRR
jgi:hypothetical protein